MNSEINSEINEEYFLDGVDLRKNKTMTNKKYVYLKDKIIKMFLEPCPRNINFISDYYEDEIKDTIKYYINDIHIDWDKWSENLYGDGLLCNCKKKCKYGGCDLDRLYWMTNICHGVEYADSDSDDSVSDDFYSDDSDSDYYDDENSEYEE